MDFTLLYTKNKQQGIVRTFRRFENLPSRIIDLAETHNFSIQGFLFSEELKSDDFFTALEGELKFYPIRGGAEFHITAELFEKMNYEEARTVFDKMRENWIIQNNVSLIEEIFKVRNHLFSLWPNDRSGFFEELWFILKNNLGTSSLQVTYNDLVKTKNDFDKNKLIKVKVVGGRYPELVSPDEADDLVLKNYENDFGNFFEITDYNKEKGHLVICASIKKSPVLIMANVYQLTMLQKALLTSLFEGLNT